MADIEKSTVPETGDGKEIAADGDFGPNTKAALIKLQAELGLAQDGICGKDTWKAALTALW